jgi:hypothetical protein
MRQALCIVRKDARHFRVHLSGFLILMALYGWMESALPRLPAVLRLTNLFELVLMLGAWYLVLLAIHEEKLPGDNQYWLTRPIHRRHLLLGKTLFIAFFFNLPLLVVHIVALSSNGLSPLHFVVALAARQLFFIVVLLPVAAMAAVTENLMQFALAAFLAFGAILLAGLGMAEAAPQYRPDGFQWILTSALGSFALIVLVGVLLLQYSRRNSLLSRLILTGGFLACGVMPMMNLWSCAFMLQARWSRLPDIARNASIIQMALDPARDPSRDVALGHAGQPFVRLSLPVHVSGIPAGMEVISERINATLEVPGERSWNSGWVVPGETPQRRGQTRVLPKDGSGWQYLNVERDVFERVKDKPAHLHIKVALTLLGKPTITRVRVPTLNRFIPEVGICHAIPNRVMCFSPFGHADWIDVQAQTPGTAGTNDMGIRPDVSYGLDPTAPTGLGPWKTDIDDMFMANLSGKDMVFETRQALAHFVRELDIHQVRLAGYRN